VNRLSEGKSPYLIQHANNPVNWQPWGESALNEAKERDVPIFLSIGYSTCHWCHVMEKESFRDEEVARELNNNFVCIKVDREERPDIDKLYMDFCHILTGTGGWPLTIIMTKDLMPFYSATYLPKRTKYNLIGLLELIEKVSTLWKNDRELVQSIASRVTKHFKKSLDKLSVTTYRLDFKSLCDDAFFSLKSIYDKSRGGFGKAPKFPMPVYLLFLIDYYNATSSQEALTMLKKTLLSMKMGGIYDHIGFGFHRYSTDAQWSIPHFEKMLYDQALLLLVYVRAYELTGITDFKDTAKEIITYVFRELSDEAGIFYSAQDADTEGVEGLYYLWTVDELKELLTEEQFEIIKNMFYISNEGNFEGNGKNIFYIRPDYNGSLHNDDTMRGIIDKLYNHRLKRSKPFLDKKILTDWNALMIYALAKAGTILKDNFIMDKAQSAIENLLNRLYDREDGLAHYSIDDYVLKIAFLDDYAFVINAIIGIYLIAGNKKYLDLAIEITDYVINHFYDHKNGGFYFTDDAKDRLILRQKDITDAVLPSGNGIMMKNLLNLYKSTGDERYKDLALSIPKSFSSTIKGSAQSCCTILSNAMIFDITEV